jgi:hypothetical protein
VRAEGVGGARENRHVSSVAPRGASRKCRLGIESIG